MHKIKNNPISDDDLVNKQYVDNSILTKQDKTDNALDTTDKTVVGAINEINDSLLDNVTFSADYKNIIINRKSGLNPYTIPISAIIHNAKIIELNDIDATNIGDGKTLVYDGTTQKHKYVDSTGTDELVKMDSTTDAKHLSELIDKSTIVNDNGILKVKKLDGQDVTIAEINHLKGLTMNVMDLVNTFANGGVKVLNTPVNTHADLSTLDRSTFLDGISYIVYVLADETHSGAKTTYLCDKTSETFFGNADSQRNFTTNPINLANEVTGKLDATNIDVDALWKLLTINDTYKTLTTKNEPFGTHGAKALYDELVTDIGNKANDNDLANHTGDTNIHVTTADKTKWNEVDNKIDKTDITTIINSSSTDTQVPSAKAIYNKSKNSITNLPNVTDIKSYAETFGNLFITDTVRLRDSTSSPYGVDNNINDFYYTIYNMDKNRYKRIIAYDIRKNDMYMIMRNADGWGKWQRVCTTTIADVPVTKININASYMSGANCYYEVKNGICYINFLSGTYVVSSQLDGVTLATGLPKPSAPEVAHTYILWAGLPSQQVILFVNNDGRLVLHAPVSSNGGCIFTSFSYPVKES